MNHSSVKNPLETSARRPTNVTLPEALLLEARNLQINLSQASERGVVLAVAERRRQLWLEENKAAIAAWNAHVDEHGLPLSGYRQF